MSVKCLISSCYTYILCSNPGSASELLGQRNDRETATARFRQGTLLPCFAHAANEKTLERTQQTPNFTIKQGLNYYH